MMLLGAWQGSDEKEADHGQARETPHGRMDSVNIGYSSEERRCYSSRGDGQPQGHARRQAYVVGQALLSHHDHGA